MRAGATGFARARLKQENIARRDLAKLAVRTRRPKSFARTVVHDRFRAAVQARRSTPGWEAARFPNCQARSTGLLLRGVPA